MSLPPIAPYPPARLRTDLTPEEWEACLDAWLSLSGLYLRLQQSEFEKAAAETSSLISFLKSYFHELPSEQHVSAIRSKDQTLKRTCFILVHRILLEEANPPSSLLRWEFISDFCHAYIRTQSLDTLLKRLWQRKEAQWEASLRDLTSILSKRLESSQPENALEYLKRIYALLYTSPKVGIFFMTGSDFMDAISTAYSSGSADLQEALVTTTFLSILSAMKNEKPNYSLIFDHLYSLRSQIPRDQKTSLLADLVTNTPLLSKLRTSVGGKDAERATNLAAVLDKYRTPSLMRPRRPTRRVTRKGKGKMPKETFTHESSIGDHHIHRMSLITQVQDLFPDLGSGFISRLLDEYNESVEEATAHLLDESLPAHLSALDRSAELPSPGVTETQREHQRIEHLAPRSTPPFERRNVFDNDEFDRLEVDSTRLHIGRKDATLTADQVLSDRTKAPAKSAIIAALAAFDSDDDERDDTYDEADVGGYVDAARPDGEDKRDVDVGASNANEAALYRAWQTDRGVFERTADIRRSKPRQALKAETGMTDETIEGWGIMFSRDVRQQRRLESKYSAFHGGQNEIARTSYREGENDSEDSDGGGNGSGYSRGGRGGGRGRGGHRGGRGRGGAGRGGSAAGAPNEKSTQIARQRKEARGSSRRDGRARKMARAGFAG
ncbi:hypothetical protein AAFC00_005934 [Neodothiora populina]|uniref:CUE domain-containing protein n=1 Tax=Neodothiora populina TaxID=2781224 RepID=A0ABR3P6N6_9PEZI